MIECLIGVVVLLFVALVVGGFAAAIAIDVLRADVRDHKRVAEERRKELEKLRRRVRGAVG